MPYSGGGEYVMYILCLHTHTHTHTHTHIHIYIYIYVCMYVCICVYIYIYIYIYILEMLIDGPITITEIRLALSQLKLNRAAGSDGIPSEFLKYGGRDIVDILYILFNYIWERGEFPKTWAEGIINPLHKKGDVNTPDNYRKVTIMNSTCKVFEIVLNNRFKFKNEMLCQDDHYQTGFVQNGRTSDNIFILHTAISIAIDDKRPLYCCFIDFTKAFDYINRYALFYKLTQSGVKGKSLKILIDMFKNSFSMVRVNGELSEKIDSLYGVLQGGVLSPKLFTNYLNDIGECFDLNLGIDINMWY